MWRGIPITRARRKPCRRSQYLLAHLLMGAQAGAVPDAMVDRPSSGRVPVGTVLVVSGGRRVGHL